MDVSHSIPVIELWGNLVVPIQGEISDTQMQELSMRVLERVRNRGSEGLVLDVSGVWMIDSHLCAALGRLAGAARLMGTHTVLCGLSPNIVMTLQTMGIELEGVDTSIGLEDALESLGIHRSEVVQDESEDTQEEE